jgi:DNA mismatch repair protein MutS
VFQKVRARVAEEIAEDPADGPVVAALDAAASLAQVAGENKYVHPEIDESTAFEVRDARHPVLEVMIEDKVVPNDIVLTGEKPVALITGPNMAGKSTYIRQAALVALLAQMGSYVPAGSAKLGVVDRIFTRVGAADELTRGQSTFMVEMSETANILNNATNKSLIILDESGGAPRPSTAFRSPGR